MTNDNMVQVEVVYPLPNEQKVLNLVVRSDQTVEEIILQSGVLELYPDIDLKVNKIGVFSRNVKLDATVRNRDRIEIYRPLLADPKEIRMRKVARDKKAAAQKIVAEKTEKRAAAAARRAEAKSE
ncbi:MAG: RnfH family protein [Aliivibrio sp.]|uniref:RnfH family protein n=1 Tax=Aliivibrio sp. TaxID=1872443 RepID=UPI001A5DE156|nr:RnfH family protein [Aliivibrio sp.]